MAGVIRGRSPLILAVEDAPQLCCGVVHLGGFIEGVARFGTPAVICAPLLLGLGSPPLAAVMVTLIYNSTPVTFGAVGMPIWGGIGETLKVDSVIRSLPSGLTYRSFIHSIAVDAAIIHTIIGFFIPLIGVIFLTKFFGERRSFKQGLAAWPFALFSVGCFVVPYLLTALLLGSEFPSIFASAIALPIVIIAASKKFLTPKKIWNITSDIETNKQPLPSRDSDSNDMALWLAWLPYMLIAIILIITRLRLTDLPRLLQDLNLSWNNIFNSEISYRVAPLYLPGILPFLPVALLTTLIHRMSIPAVKKAWQTTLNRVLSPSVALFFAVALVEIMSNSGHNPLQIEAMPIVMTRPLPAL